MATNSVISSYRRHGDPYKRLSAAVMACACRDAVNPKGSNAGGQKAWAKIWEEAHLQESARNFVQGDMWPYADILEMDPEADEAWRTWLRDNGLKPVD